LAEISGSYGGEYEDVFFWVGAPCSLVEVYRRFRGACCLQHQGDEYTAQQPRRQPSAYKLGYLNWLWNINLLAREIFDVQRKDGKISLVQQALVLKA
jgi:hypothetical protein